MIITKSEPFTLDEIDFNSFINIRPKDNNTKNDIQDEKTRNKYKKLTEYFFKEML